MPRRYTSGVFFFFPLEMHGGGSPICVVVCPPPATIDRQHKGSWQLAVGTLVRLLSVWDFGTFAALFVCNTDLGGGYYLGNK